VEGITITEHLNFNLGNVIKYIWRSSEKKTTIEDLKKACWYLNREIGRLEKIADEEVPKGKPTRGYPNSRDLGFQEEND
jgi:hypothetical protein